MSARYSEKDRHCARPDGCSSSFFVCEMCAQVAADHHACPVPEMYVWVPIHPNADLHIERLDL
jgi:hypothetical protein